MTGVVIFLLIWGSVAGAVVSIYRVLSPVVKKLIALSRIIEKEEERKDTHDIAIRADKRISQHLVDHGKQDEE